MIPSRRHRSLTVTSRRKPSRTFGSSLRGCTYVGQPPSLCGRKTWSARFVPRRPLLCLLPTGTHLLLSVGNSTLISGAHTTLRLSGFLTLQYVPLSLTIYNLTISTGRVVTGRMGTRFPGRRATRRGRSWHRPYSSVWSGRFVGCGRYVTDNCPVEVEDGGAFERQVAGYGGVAQCYRAPAVCDAAAYA